MANRIHFARFSLVCEIHHSDLHMVPHGISLWPFVLGNPSAQTRYRYGASHRWHLLSWTSFFLLSHGGIYPKTMKFTIFAYQGCEAVTLRSISSCRKSFIDGSWVLVLVMRDKWSATEFSTPFLSLISRSNSWSRRIHLINLGLASFLVKRCLSTTWSV